jgi:predicted Zn-ribbon and HTH transcriptional regulator
VLTRAPAVGAARRVSPEDWTLLVMSTWRQAIKEILQTETLSSLELSQRLSLPEKEVLEHLAHLARAPGQGYRFQVTPAVCKHCGFAFKKRERLTTPSRCPLCRHEAIRRPQFALIRQ